MLLLLLIYNNGILISVEFCTSYILYKIWEFMRNYIINVYFYYTGSTFVTLFLSAVLYMSLQHNSWPSIFCLSSIRLGSAKDIQMSCLLLLFGSTLYYILLLTIILHNLFRHVYFELVYFCWFLLFSILLCNKISKDHLHFATLQYALSCSSSSVHRYE